MSEQTKALAMAALVAIVGCSSSKKDEPAGTTYRYVLVANGAPDNSVSVVSLATKSVEATIPVSIAFPWEITVSPDGKRAYVSCRGGQSPASPGGISILDLVAKTEIGTIADLSGYDPARTLLVGNKLYVGYAGGPIVGSDTIVSVADVSAGTPAETDVITLVSGWNGGSLSFATNAAGTKLYVGDWGTNVYVVNLADGTVLDTLTVSGNIAHSLTRVGSLVYVANEEGNDVVEAIDTSTDTVSSADEIELGTDGQMQAMVFDGGKVYVANDLGGIAKIDLNRNMDDYVWFQDDDGGIDVDLPWAFPFQGSSYTTATVSSNGHVNFNSQYSYYDGTVADLAGFAAFQQDLDSSDGRLFGVSYNRSADGQRGVFEWCTSTNADDSDPAAAMLFEIVLFGDGRARFDYRIAGPDAVNEDDGYDYGVGDGTDVLVDMRTAYGSPFELRHRSFMWNPGPATVTEVPFTWEGTGVEWIPTYGTPHDLVLANGYLISPLTRDPYYASQDKIAFYNAATMEPEILVTVGSTPRAVALVP